MVTFDDGECKGLAVRALDVEIPGSIPGKINLKIELFRFGSRFSVQGHYPEHSYNLISLITLIIIHRLILLFETRQLV